MISWTAQRSYVLNPVLWGHNTSSSDGRKTPIGWGPENQGKQRSLTLPKHVDKNIECTQQKHRNSTQILASSWIWKWIWKVQIPCSDVTCHYPVTLIRSVRTSWLMPSLFSWFPGLHRCRISIIQVSSIVKPLKQLIQATACRLVKYGLKSLHDAL